jgi:hypothetical protein
MVGLVLVVCGGQAWAEPFVDAVQLGIGNHSVAMPFGQLGRFSPFYPAFELGAEHRWVSRGVFDLAHAASVGSWHHRYMGTSATLGTDLAARFTAPQGPLAQASLGAGLTYSWRSRPVVAWDEAQETYVPSGDPGRAGFMAALGLAVGYDFGRVTDAPLAVSIDYVWLAQTPYLPGIDVGPQGILSLTVRWSFGEGAA